MGTSRSLKQLTDDGVSDCRRRLYRYLRFYRLCAQIVGTMSPQLKELLPDVGLPIPEIRESEAPELAVPCVTPVTLLWYPYSDQLTAISQPLEHFFCETERIRAYWPVRCHPAEALMLAAAAEGALEEPGYGE
jgi:hypothetical protein